MFRFPAWLLRTFSALAFAAPASAQTGSAAPPLLWQAESVKSIAIASNGACVAARTESRIRVMDDQGRQIWETPEQPAITHGLGTHAVSPTCDWIAVFLHDGTPDSRPLELVRRDGSRVTVPISAAADVNPPSVRSLDISPDGQWLAVGFEANQLWIVSRDGAVRSRMISLQGAGVTARFVAEGRQVLRTGWFDAGVVDLDGRWVMKHNSRQLDASRNLDLFAALTASMHGPQHGEIAILNAAGKPVWQGSGYDASMAIAPDGCFVVFASRTASPNQPKQPPFPAVPELNETPEIWVRDRAGIVLAHQPFAGRVVGVSNDSTCILAARDYSGTERMPERQRPWLAGYSRDLKPVWRIENLSGDQTVNANLLADLEGGTLRVWRLPDCGRQGQ